MPGWSNQYSSIKDGSYKNFPIEVDAFKRPFLKFFKENLINQTD